MAVINPPNTPLIDGRGLITAPWYRFLVAIQKDMADTNGYIEAEALLSGGANSLAGMTAARVETDPALILPPAPVQTAHDDLTPPVIHIPQDDLMTPYRVQMA